VTSNRLQRRVLFLSACAGILVFGCVLAILGTLFGMSGMRERLHVDLAGQGTLFLLLYFGIFIASLLVGPIADYAGKKPILLVSALLVSASMFAFSAAQSMRGAGGAAILLGFGGGGLNTCTNALVSDLYQHERGRMLNLLGIFFGIGALCIPLLAASIAGLFSPRQLLIGCALASALCALAYGLLRFPPAEPGQRLSLLKSLSVARHPGVWLIGLLLFFQSGNEACIGGWTSTYVNVSGFSSRTATLLLAGYWAALMMSRMLAAGLLRLLSKTWLVLGSAGIALIGMGILLSSHSLFGFGTGIGLIGLSFGPIFPTVLAIAGDQYPRTAGTVFGLLFSIALVGGMSFPWAVGQLSQRFGIASGLFVPLLGAGGICFCSALLMKPSRGLRQAKSASC
jgi:fucose permease